MNFVLERVTQPEIEPVTLAEMKRHLRIDSDITASDDDITALIVAAREWVEEETGRALVDQTWRLTISQNNIVVSSTQTDMVSGVFTQNTSGILLRRAPLIAIVSVSTVDADGEETEIDSDDYQLREADSKWPRIVGLNGATWPTVNTRIVFRAGFANRDISPADGTDVIPEIFKLGMKLHAEAYYDRSERMMQTLLDAAKNAVKPERSNLQLS